jgi:hypothetical protein
VRASARAVAILLIVAGCRHGGGAPAGPSPAASSPAVRPRQSRVFLLRFGSDLVPLACFDARADELRRGEDCLELIAGRPEVRVVQQEGGSPRERTLRVTAAPVEFTASEQIMDGYRLDLTCPRDGRPKPPCVGPDTAAGSFAVWPPGFGGVSLAERGRPTEPLPVEVAGELTRQLRDCRSGEVPALAVHQRLRLDLDGDGVPEELLTVRATPIEAATWDDSMSQARGDAGCLPPDVDRPQSWFFTYVKRGPRFVRVPLDALPSGAPFAGGSGDTPGTSVDAEVLASFDLDGDGAAELWMEQPYYEGMNWVVVHLRDGVFEVIDHFVDGT